MAWGWRGRGWFGPWPGRGPFSYLPPWQRPGWLFGPGACWWLLGLGTGWPYTYGFPQRFPMLPPKEELSALEESKKALEEELKGIEARIEELKKTLK
ncbi:MAG: hypothetical protein QXG01_08720 [Candidatus Bathyarchaeia archaeon]